MLDKNDQPAQPESSPVADSKKKSPPWIVKILFFIASLIFLGLAALSQMHKQKVAPEHKTQVEPASMASLAAPQLNEVKSELDSIKNSLPAIQNVIPDQENEAEKLLKTRMIARSTVYSSGQTNASANKDSSQKGTNLLGQDANSQFAAQASQSAGAPIMASRMAHPSTTLAQGTMIWATLETRIASDLPGMVRAITAEDIYSEDGSQILIPKGSRLVGQYSSGIQQGQQRIFVLWQRLIRPDHIDIQLNSPGTDPLGTAGFGADAIDRHFIEQFGQATLLSLIGAGAANVGVDSQAQPNSASAYREALSNSFSQSAQNALQSRGNISPTLYKNQGQPINVFVSRDLDFYNQVSK